MLTDAGRKQLIADEGSRLKMYDDATGKPVARLASGGVPTIGVGRNLSDRGLTQQEVDYLLNNDIAGFWADITRLLPWLSPYAGKNGSPRTDVILMVEFNTGDVLQFRKMLAAFQAGKFDVAADELLDSKAAGQGPARYMRMADALRGNVWASGVAAPMPTIKTAPPTIAETVPLPWKGLPPTIADFQPPAPLHTLDREGSL